MFRTSQVIVLAAVAVSSVTCAEAQSAGVVSVLYAGSLGALMEKGLGPALERTTGMRRGGKHGRPSSPATIADGVRARWRHWSRRRRRCLPSPQTFPYRDVRNSSVECHSYRS